MFTKISLFFGFIQPLAQFISHIWIMLAANLPFQSLNIYFFLYVCHG